MRYLIALLLGGSTCFAPVTHNYLATIAKINTDAGGGPSYLLDEGFEGTGTPTGWTVENGTPDFDETTVVAAGSQSLHLDATEEETSTDPVDQATVYWFHAIRISSVIDSGWWVFSNGAFHYKVTGTGAIQLVDPDFGNRAATSAGVITSGTWHYIWGRYTKGTGANATVQMWVSATTTKPGSPQINTTAGEGTINFTYLDFYREGAADVYVDYVIIDDAEIGSAP